MSKIYEVTHRNAHGILKAHILNYLNECKENGYDILNIELCAECPVNFILSWPPKEEIISNGYENIIIHVICDAVNFRCINFIIGDLDDSYYDVNNIHENQFETIPSIYIKNVTGDITINNCCSFYTRIIIDAPYMQSLIIRRVSYVDYLKLEHCVNMHMIQLRDGSFVDKLKLYKCIIEHGIVECEVHEVEKDAINEIEMTLSMVFNYIMPDTIIKPIKLKENDNIKISSKLSMIIEK